MVKLLRKFTKYVLLQVLDFATAPSSPPAASAEADTPAPSATPSKTPKMTVDADIEQVLDLVVLLELREEGALKCTFHDLSVWTGISEESVRILVNTPRENGDAIWWELHEAMALSYKDRHSLRSGLLMFLSMSPDTSIKTTISDLAYQYSMKRLGSEAESDLDEKVRRAIMDRYYIYNTYMMEATEH